MPDDHPPVAIAPEAWRRDAVEIAAELGTDLRSGLSVADAAARLARFGPNQLDAATPVPRWRKLLAQFADPLIYLLVGAVVVSFVAWIFEGREGVPFEVIVIVAIVVLNAVLGFVQEARAEQAVAALARMAAPTAGVVRDGAEQRVAAADVVPGDLLLLAEGDAVSADGRLVQAASLMVAEASLTGESEAVLKASRSARRAGEPRRPGEHGVQRHSGHAWAGPSRGHGDRHEHRGGQPRPPTRAHGTGTHTAAARNRPHRSHARTRRHRHCDRRHDRHPGHGRRRGSRRPRRCAACRCVIGGRGRPGGAAGRAVGGARPRGAAHGPPAGDRQEALVGRDTRIDLGGLLRQDRHPHQERDDDREGRHPVRRGRHHRCRAPARRRVAVGWPAPRRRRVARRGALRARRRQPGQRRRTARGRGRLDRPGRSNRGGLSRGRGKDRAHRDTESEVRAGGGDPVHVRTQADDHHGVRC